MPTQSIGGDNGQPQRPAFYRVGHKPVLIDLAALYPNAPHFEGTYCPDGLQIRSVHRGVLTEWARSEWGDFFGKVTYKITAKGPEDEVTHWVPAWVLKPSVP